MKLSPATIAIRATVEFMNLIPSLASFHTKILGKRAVSGRDLAILPLSS